MTLPTVNNRGATRSSDQCAVTSEIKSRLKSVTWGWSDGCQCRPDFQQQDGEKQIESKLAGCLCWQAPDWPETLCTDVLWWGRMKHWMQHSLCRVDHLDSVYTRNNEASVVFQGKQPVAIPKYSWYRLTNRVIYVSIYLSVSTSNSPKCF